MNLFSVVIGEDQDGADLDEGVFGNIIGGENASAPLGAILKVDKV